MSCGKKRGCKLWENRQAPRTVKPSKYEQEDPADRKYWKTVINELESPYKDEKFWETSGDQVHELVGDVIFDRLRKIFHLPQKPIEPAHLKDSSSSTVSTAEYYAENTGKRDPVTGTNAARKFISASDLSLEKKDTIQEIEDESVWSVSTDDTELKSSHVRIKSKGGLLNQVSSRSIYSSKTRSNTTRSTMPSQTNACGEAASSEDDLEVQDGDWNIRRRHVRNPYYRMLYCNDSETDMIKWNSNYKTKRTKTSAEDDFSKGIEIRTKKIATEFIKWWSSMGTKDYKSELKKPADIEALFQVWFDEHASQALIRDRKILPCVLKSVAALFGAPQKSQDKALQKLISNDIKAESVPPDTVAFNASLPKNMKYYPPQNNTAKTWNCDKIPEDLRTMECVWGDIRHLKSTKSFEQWLRRHPNRPVPPILNTEVHRNSAVNFVHVSNSAEMDTSLLTIPYTHVKIEIKDVLAKLLE